MKKWSYTLVCFFLVRYSDFMFYMAMLEGNHKVNAVDFNLLILFLSVICRDFTLSLVSFHVVVSDINVNAFLWHKTDWGWLVLSWLLRSSHSLRAAGAGGGTGHSSRNGQAAAGKKKRQSDQQEAAGGFKEMWVYFYLSVNKNVGNTVT